MHAPFHTPHQGSPLVAREVVAHRGADHPAEVVNVVGDEVGLLAPIGAVAAPEEGGEAVDDLPRRLDEVDEAGADGGERHAIVAGRIRLLHDADAAMFLHRPQARGAVRPRPRQDHAGRVGLLIDGKREEEVVDGPAQPAGLHELREFEDAVLDGEAPPRRDDVDLVALDPLAALALEHLQFGVPVEELGQHALVVGVEVLDDDEGHARREAGPGEHLPQRLEPSRRGADPDDRPGEGLRCRLVRSVQDLGGACPGVVKEILVHRDPRG